MSVFEYVAPCEYSLGAMPGSPALCTKLITACCQTAGPIYGVAWSNAPSPSSRTNDPYSPRASAAAGAGSGVLGARVAISSFVEEACNEVQVLGVQAGGSDG